MSTWLVTSVADLQTHLRELRSRGRSLGLVPTMGALHEGHQSLIRRAKQQCDAVAVSIFVNPTQFNSSQDLANYPRDLQKDFEVLRELNVQLVFAPSPDEIYPSGFQTFIEPGQLAAPLEGASRPGHFRGVATIVLKLFNLVQPDVAYFGQKDFQQVQVIRRLVEDLSVSVRLVICPIAREPDGLALSSRNSLLSPEGRQAATVLNRCLREGERLVHSGEVDSRTLLECMRDVLKQEPLATLDYLELVNPFQLEPVDRVSPGTVALIAARVESVRLIDNLILGPPGASPDLLLQLAFAARQVIDSSARIPGMEIEALCRRIAACRDCAALSAVQMPPREFMAKYLKRDYQDLNSVRVMVIGRDTSMNPETYLYRSPERPSRFVTAIYELLGVKNFQQFKEVAVLTDATRCHVQSESLPARALTYCARHLREELSQFPNLQTILVLGQDAYRQFQKEIIGCPPDQLRPFEELLKPSGWAMEDVELPGRTGPLRVIYTCHPTRGYLSGIEAASAPIPLAALVGLP